MSVLFECSGFRVQESFGFREREREMEIPGPDAVLAALGDGALVAVLLLHLRNGM